jgi:hypothetical protein
MQCQPNMAAFAPIFRYFDILGPVVSQPIFETLPRVSAWRAELAARESLLPLLEETMPNGFKSTCLSIRQSSRPDIPSDKA